MRELKGVSVRRYERAFHEKRIFCGGCGEAIGDDEPALMFDCYHGRGPWHEECLGQLPGTITERFAMVAKWDADQADKSAEAAYRMLGQYRAIKERVQRERVEG